MFRSATLRLTLWYLAISMAISLLFSIVLYHVTTNDLFHGLHSESQRFYNQFPVFQNDPNVNMKPNSYYNNSTHNILLHLIGFNFIVLVAAGFCSYLLARRTLEPIEAAHNQQRRFTSDVSHELRTPLTAIKMESEVALLSDKAPVEELRNVLESNLEEVAKLEVLINNLLKLSRLEADELQQNFQNISSQDIVNLAIEKVSKTAALHSIKIGSSGKPIEISGDKETLAQLLTILLDNAIKYSPNTNKINIATSFNTDSVTWQIKDEGVGIDADALQHVFDRFYRADSSRTKVQAEGYGLGLSIAKMIADVHNGDITLKSMPGKGTTAIVSVPLEQKHHHLIYKKS
jgi:two-component system sensor histidine kinase CiaH